MTLTQIHYFLELCKTMNFTKAAQNLFVSQPTLSRQVQLLETELDVTLLKRSNREVILTRAGEVFRNEFSKIDEEIELAIMRVSKADENRKEIRIGFAEQVIAVQMLRLVEDLKAYFPGYSIQMNQGYYHELRHQFERGLLDIVVSIERIGSTEWSCQWKKVYELPAYFTYMPQLFQEDYTPTWEDFKQKKFIFSGRPGASNIVQRQREILQSIGIDLQEDSCFYTDEVLSGLMLTHADDAYAVYCNPTECGIMTLPLPEHAKKFRMFACWNRETMPHLTDFFNAINPDEES